MSLVDAVWDSSDETGLVVPALLRGRRFRVLRIAAGPDSEGFGVEYEVVPGLEWPPEDGDHEHRRKWAAGNSWELTGRDDVGTEYEATGGAAGSSASGERTRGVTDMYPSPPPDASWLDLTFQGAGSGGRSGGRQFVLRVPLPLRVLTYEEIAREKGMSEEDLQRFMQIVQQVQAAWDPEEE